MLNVLIESGARPSARRAPWTAASLAGHVAVIVVAAILTAKDAVPSIAPPYAEPVHFVPTPPAASSGSPSADSPPAGPVIDLPKFVVPVVPGFDVVPPVVASSIGADILTRESSGILRGAESSGIPAGGVYSDQLVDRAVVARTGNGSPEYPSQLRASGVQGDVLVRFVVDTTGRVEARSIVVLQATHPLFADAVRRWVSRTRYEPAEVGGRPVRQLVEQRASFTLQP